MKQFPPGYYFCNESNIGCVVRLLEDNSTEHTTDMQLEMLYCDLDGQIGRRFNFYRLRGGHGTVFADKLSLIEPQPESDLECANCLFERCGEPHPQIEVVGDGGAFYVRYGGEQLGPLTQFENVWQLVDVIARCSTVRLPTFDFNKFKSQIEDPQS